MVENPYSPPSSPADRSPLGNSLRSLRWLAVLGVLIASFGLIGTVPRLISPPSDINPRWYVCLCFRIPVQILLVVGAGLLLAQRRSGPLILTMAAWFSIFVTTGWMLDQFARFLPNETMNWALLINSGMLFAELLVGVTYPVLVLIWLQRNIAKRP